VSHREKRRKRQLVHESLIATEQSCHSQNTTLRSSGSPCSLFRSYPRLSIKNHPTDKTGTYTETRRVRLTILSYLNRSSTPPNRRRDMTSSLFPGATWTRTSIVHGPGRPYRLRQSKGPKAPGRRPTNPFISLHQYLKTNSRVSPGEGTGTSVVQLIQ
jgi:hypothetical protein